MLLLVPAHPGCPGQIPHSRKTVVCVCLCRTKTSHKNDNINNDNNDNDNNLTKNLQKGSMYSYLTFAYHQNQKHSVECTWHEISEVEKVKTFSVLAETQSFEEESSWMLQVTVYPVTILATASMTMHPPHVTLLNLNCSTS